MKTILISGSPRRDGNTEFLMDYIKNKMNKEVIQINLSDKKIGHCLHCDGCVEKNSCVQSDDFNEIYKTVQETDHIVLGSPVYVGMPTSKLLALLQRMTYVSFVNGGTLKNKYGASVAIGGETGQLNALNILNNFFMANGMNIINSNYFLVGKGSKKGDIVKDEQVFNYVNDLIDNLRKVAI